MIWNYNNSWWNQATFQRKAATSNGYVVNNTTIVLLDVIL